MLYRSQALKGYALHSLDGAIGSVKDFYFDDHHWTVRYLVADTGGWLTGKQVLISPYALINVNQEEQYIAINLTKDHIEKSPSLNSDKPVSRQFEEEYYPYYGWPLYWGGAFAWGALPYMARSPEQGKHSEEHAKDWDPHLRSTHGVSGYAIEASDGEIGHVEDFILDDETWAIRYLIIDTRNWWPGKHVLISPRWIDDVSWSQSKIFVNLSRESIQQAPEYTEESQLTRGYEARLHQHYNRQGYWGEELAGAEHSH